jgi:hypothetical protein
MKYQQGENERDMTERKIINQQLLSFTRVIAEIARQAIIDIIINI